MNGSDDRGWIAVLRAIHLLPYHPIAAASPITQEHLAGEKKRFSWNGLHGEQAFADYGFEFFDPGKNDREFLINNPVDCQSVRRTCGVELPLGPSGPLNIVLQDIKQ